jgi:hypothetical protein
LNSTERKSQLDGLATEFQGQVKECAASTSLVLAIFLVEVVVLSYLVSVLK